MAGSEPTTLAAKQAQYKSLIEKARREAPAAAPLQNLPAFDSLPKAPPGPDPSRPPPLTRVSTKTAAGLEKLAAAQPALEVATSSPEVVADAVIEKTEAKEEDDDIKKRKAIEARIAPFDIGQYLISGGTMTQVVPIIPGKFEVEFRTVTDYEEAYVENKLANDTTLTSGRQVDRRQMEWAIAAHVHALNGTVWTNPLKPDGTVDDTVMIERFKKVSKLTTPILSLLAQNCSWFLERVNKGLTVEALKNG